VVCGGHSWQHHFDLIDEAPAPIFTGLERGDNRMARHARMFARMAIF
jgi:hypothetical protein